MKKNQQKQIENRYAASVHTSVKALLGLLTLVVAISSHAASETWTGGNTPDFNWNTNANWSTVIPVTDDQLFFNGSVGLNNTNNIGANTEFGGLTFNSGGGSFQLFGNAITLANGGGITNNSAIVQTNRLTSGLGVTNNNIVNYVTTPGGGQLVISSAINWASGAQTNDALVFSGANIKDIDTSSTSSFGMGGSAASISNIMILRNSIVDGNNSAGVSNGRRINIGNGFANTFLLDNSVATNMDGLIVGNGAASFNNSLIVSNGSKIYINGTDLYELGRNAGAQNDNIIITGPGSALLSGGHAFNIGGSSGATTNMTVQVLNGGLWNLGGSTFRLNFSMGPQMNLLVNNGTVSNVFSMIIGNGVYSNTVSFANGSKFNFSASSGDFREMGRGANAFNNTLTIQDPNTFWDDGGATFTIGGTFAGANNFSNIMTIANSAVFTNGSITVGGQGTFQTLIISNAAAYINALILNGGNSVVYLEGGSGDAVFVDTLGNNATGVLTNTAQTVENLVLGWKNGSQTGSAVPLMSGLMNITKTGTGAQNLNNANTFIGNILVAGGTLGTSTIQAAADGSTSAFGCLTNVGKTLIVTNGGTLNLGINNALLNGLTPDTLPPITVYSGSTLSSSRFNAIGQLTLNGGTLLQNSTDASPLNGYQFYTNITVGGSAAATISAGANGLPDDLNATTSGGTTFNVANTASGGADLTVSAALADYSDGITVGSLTKTGVGIMMSTGTNTYTGLTTVSSGELGLSTYSPQSGGITVKDGAILDVTVSGTSQMVPSALTLGSSTGAIVQFVNLANLTPAPVIATTLTLNGTTTINLKFPSIANGNQYPLITYTTIGGTGGFVLGAGRPGSSMNLVTNNNGNGTFTIALNVVNTGSATTDIWSGAISSNWEFASANWTVGGVAATYFDGDFVVFTNGTSKTNVTIATTVAPGSVTVNSASNYVFIASGGGHITGTGGLSKSGSGSLTLTNMANTYIGTNTITGGAVVVSADVNLGATTNAIILNGGALSAVGTFTMNPSKALNLGPASGSGTGALDVVTNQILTYNGVVANNNTGTGSLIKTGSGVLSLGGANTYSGSTLVSGGKLIVTTSQQSGGAITVSDAAALTVLASGGLTLPTASLTLGTSGSTTLTLQGVSGTNAAITATNLIANGTVSVSVIGGAVKIGEVPLIQYTTLTGTIANFALAPTLPPNVSAVLTNDTAGKFIGLVITSINGLTWTGVNGPNWDIATTTNWLYGTTNSVYSDGSAVLFNDSGANSVSIRSLVSPSGVLVNNSSITYTFAPATGSAGIGGPGGFVKLGLGTLNYSSVTNSYSGITVIGNGQIVLGAHATTADPGSQLLEFSTNSLIITNNAFLQLNGVGGGPTVWSQYMSNSITLDNGNIFGTDGGQHLDGSITIEPGGAALGEQQTNKFLFLDGPVSGTGTISVPLPNGGGNDGIHTPGGGGYAGPYFTFSANPYSGTISVFNGNIGIQDINGTCLANATLDLEGFNGNVGNPLIWTFNLSHSIFLGGLMGTNVGVNLNLTEPIDGFPVSLTLGNNTSSTLVYNGALSDTSGSEAVTKVGSDAQWLVGTNTYPGATFVNSGELGISTLHAGNGSFMVADGASLGVTNIITTNAPSSALLSTLTLGSGGATTVEFQNVTNTTTPVINCGGGLMVNGTSTIKITGTTGLSAPNTYPLIASTGISGGGHFTLLLPPGVNATLVTNLNTIALNLISFSGINTNPTNILFSVSGGNLSLSWPADHLGWFLQVQTNALSKGISTNWVDVAGSSSVTNVIVPINPNNPTVFYRMSLQP